MHLINKKQIHDVKALPWNNSVNTSASDSELILLNSNNYYVYIIIPSEYLVNTKFEYYTKQKAAAVSSDNCAILAY